jgi:hypothetical protein
MHRAAIKISNYWKRRPKRLWRRVAHDLRMLAPALAILFCIVSTAAVIAAAESIPMQSIPPTDHSLETTSFVEVSSEDVDASRVAAFRPTRADCARVGLLDDLD